VTASTSQLEAICLDCPAPAELAPAFWLYEVPEPKAGRNRAPVDGRLDAESVDPLVALGATVLGGPGGDIDRWVLADPEGNEFCAFRRSAP
jgi:hypothetical protein